MEQHSKYIFNGEACRDLPGCLARFQEAKQGDRFVVCDRGDHFIQACDGKEKDAYDCEVRWNNALYASPESVSWEKLIELMDRFSSGEDFSFVEQSWKPVDLGDDRKARKIVAIVASIIVITIVLLAFVYQRS